MELAEGRHCLIVFVDVLTVDGGLLDGDADEGYNGVEALYFVPNCVELRAMIG